MSATHNSPTGLSLRADRVAGSLTTLAHDLALAQGPGVEAVESALTGLDVVSGGRLHRPRERQVRQVVAGSPTLQTSVHGPHVADLGDLTRGKRRHGAALASLEFSIHVGDQALVSHNSCLTEPGPRTTELENLALPADAGGGEVTPKVGNGAHLVDDPLSLTEEIDRPDVGIAYHFGHAQVAPRDQGFDPLNAVESALLRIVRFHVPDNFGRGGVICHPPETGRPLGEGDLHLPPGVIPSCETFAGLQHFQDLYILELHPSFFQPGRAVDAYPEIEESLLRMRALGERSVPPIEVQLMKLPPVCILGA
ncbi:MAG: hypothetical protein ACP5G2_06880 [Candidatus Bipolaricaulaceae bacterium]